MIDKDKLIAYLDGLADGYLTKVAVNDAHAVELQSLAWQVGVIRNNIDAGLFDVTVSPFGQEEK